MGLIAGSRIRGLSLEHRLPLLITALLVVTMGAGVLFAYSEVKGVAIQGVRQRLELVSQQLAGVVGPSLGRRVAVLGEVASNPAVVAAASDPGEGTRAAAMEVLGDLRTVGQPALPIVLRSIDRQVVLQVGTLPGSREGMAALLAALPDSGGVGRFVQVGGQSYFWVSAPVRAGGRTVGHLAEARAVGGANTADQVETLIGSGISVFFANTASGPWIGLDGAVVQPLAPWPFTGARESGGEGGRRFYAHAAPVPGTPFSLVATVPHAAVLQRPTLFLSRAVLAALLLILAGAAAAWVLSRSVTRPVKELWIASKAIARGEYGRRIDLDRNDELGTLAAAFNDMSHRVLAAHDELRNQVAAAQALSVKLEEASRVKSEFVATMSHEIRTPINAMLGYADLLQLEVAGPLTDAQRRQLEQIKTSGRHLVALVDQVLGFSRVESEPIRADATTAPVKPSVETALTVVRPQAGRREIQLVAEYPEGPDLAFLGDPQHVNQILVNLLANAIKFTEPGGRATIRSRTRTGALPDRPGEGRWTCIEVEDDGPGIPADQLEAIFQPFVQLESGYTRRYEGAGLGLTISLRLASSMGGTLSVESEPGVGSRFTLWLPAASVAQGPAPVAGASPAAERRLPHGAALDLGVR